MTIHEFGNERAKTLLMFPGSCTSREDYIPAAKRLGGSFHVLLVTPNGHDPAERTDFLSVEKTVDDAVAWLKAHGIARLDAPYGLSFGGGMVARFLTTQDIPVNQAIIDAGTAPYAYPKWLCGLICVRDFVGAKLAVSFIPLMKAAFPPSHFAFDPKNVDAGYRELKRFLKTFSNRTIRNIFWSANNYAAPHPAPKLNTAMQFWVGTEEWGSRFRDLKWYEKYFPRIEVVKIPGMMHGELVMMHPEAFAERARAFLCPDAQKETEA